MTPASLRFLGRRVYLGLIVVLVPVLRHGASPTRVRRLRELVGVSRRTVERWRRWWCSEFVQTPFWRLARGRFAQPVTYAALPRSLLERFVGDAAGKLEAQSCHVVTAPPRLRYRHRGEHVRACRRFALKCRPEPSHLRVTTTEKV